MGKEKQHFRVGSAVGIICINYLFENFSNAKIGLFTGLLRLFVACVLCTEDSILLFSALLYIFYTEQQIFKLINYIISMDIFFFAFLF